MAIDLNLSETIDLTETLEVHNAMYTPFYGSIALADSYFQYKLYTDAWDIATNIEKQSALVEASRAINRLNFLGIKLVDTQDLQFPRDYQTIVPKDIEFATFEIALKLLDGIDPEIERDNLTTNSRGFGSVRVNYDRGSVPSHIIAGIASSVAWNLLLPYLSDPGDVIIRRGS